jgi:hypothetical protein
LTILAVQYGSFIPALSEHHAGGTNVGRILINGERIGGGDVRERYFLGGAFARELRVATPGVFADLYGTYGPRSFLYAEMVFGNVANAQHLAATPQTNIYAMRTRRDVSVDDVVRRSRLSIDEVRRFNPALTRRAPAGATVYLPTFAAFFGSDVSFWHRPPTQRTPVFSMNFNISTRRPGRIVALTRRWRMYRARFAATRTEEGQVMATMLAYVLQDRKTSGQREILADFRTSPQILQLFTEARSQQTSRRGVVAKAGVDTN